MTRRQRLERKLELRREWAEKAEQRSTAEFNAAHRITEHIPFGQPILVGHHSEAAHRRLIERSAAHMDHACEQYDKAQYHESKANGLERQLENTIFSDDPDAIKRLQEKLAGLEKLQEQMKGINKINRACKKLSDEETIARIKAAYPTLSDESAREIVVPPPCLSFLGRGIPSYHLANNNANIRRIKQRIEEITRRQERQTHAENAPGGILIEPNTWGYCRITFSEKPDRQILNDLKAAGFRWCKSYWFGSHDKIPDTVKQLAANE